MQTTAQLYFERNDFLQRGPIENPSIIFLLNNLLSFGQRLDINPLWTTTSSSFHFAPEFIRSFFKEGQVVNVLPLVNPDSIKNFVP